MLPDQKEWSINKTRTVLFFGYLPDYGRVQLPKNVREAAKEDQITGGKNELIRQGRDCLRRTFERQISKIPADTNHVIPLSGGLDSRTILAALLDYDEIDNSNITTITFGTPGTWDFELSQQVAEATGIKKEFVDLPTIEWLTYGLLNVIEQSENIIPNSIIR